MEKLKALENIQKIIENEKKEKIERLEFLNSRLEQIKNQINLILKNKICDDERY